MSLLTPHYSDLVDMVQPLDPFHPLSRGCVAAYLTRSGMDGGNRLIDLHNPGPHGKHGTLTNGPTWTRTPWDTAAVSAAGTANVTFDDSKLPSPSVVTLSLWFYGDVEDNAVVFHSDAMKVSAGFLATGNGTLALGSEIAAGNVDWRTQLTSTYDFRWTHLLVEYTSTTITPYLDNVLLVNGGGGGGWLVKTGTSLFCRYTDDTPSEYWAGSVADPIIFNRALSGAERTLLASARSDPTYNGWIQSPRRWSPAAVAGAVLAIAGDTLNLADPYSADDEVATAAATGGSTPYSYAITAQTSDTEVLEVTGTLDPDATGIYVEDGTYGGEAAYTKVGGGWFIWAGAGTWHISDELGNTGSAEWTNDSSLGDYAPYGLSDATGTATVAATEPFQINASTGAITIADPDPLVVGHVWTITVEVTDDDSETADDDWTVTLAAGGYTVPLSHILEAA